MLGVVGHLLTKGIQLRASPGGDIALGQAIKADQQHIRDSLVF